MPLLRTVLLNIGGPAVSHRAGQSPSEPDKVRHCPCVPHRSLHPIGSSGPSMAGDVETIADHVSYLGYRVSLKRPGPDFYLRRILRRPTLSADA